MRRTKNRRLSMKNHEATLFPSATFPAFALPTHAEVSAFMGAIAPTLFGPEYVILAKSTNELVLCEVRHKTADGRMHARVLPFN